MEPPRHPVQVLGEMQARRISDPSPTTAVLANIQASYFFLRRGMAILALLFPLVLWIGGGLHNLQNSMSAYYHFDNGMMRNWFVGILWAIGTFLLLYKGYNWWEDTLLGIAGVMAISVAMFPMDWPESANAASSLHAMIHAGSALCFFLCLAAVALFCSNATLKVLNDASKRRKYKRLYAIWGLLMVGLPIFITAVHLLWGAKVPWWLFFVEMAGVYVFSAFWLTKSAEIALIEKQT